MYTHIVKKSKFIAYSFDVANKENVKELLMKIREEHSNASHVCFAYITKGGGGMSDDGEPKGTAGKPIFNFLKITKQMNKLIIVVRYYGGKKLGAGGLIRAYVNAAKNA